MEDFLSRFEYIRNLKQRVRIVGERSVPVEVGEPLLRERLMIVTMPDGTRRATELIFPEKQGTYPAVLFVHWYEPQEPVHNNRSQFREEAIRLANRGVVCLLVETMWSDLDWFYKRTQADDELNTIRQVVELRLWMDLLLAEPGVDARRFAYVGHDFGAMHAAILATVDPRPTAYVLMAGAPNFPDWYLYYPRLEGAEKDAYKDHMAPYDPCAHIGKLTNVPVLFQFGNNDPHVPLPRAHDFFACAVEPKEMRFYEAGHGLNETAEKDRQLWLEAVLHAKLPPR